MGEENSENKMAEGNWIQVGNATMLLQQNPDEEESLVTNARPLKISDPTCSTYRNPADIDYAEQLLQKLASPDRLPRNQFIVERIPEYLVNNTETPRLLLHRSVIAALPQAGCRKFLSVSVATRTRPLDASRDERHNATGRAVNGGRTLPDAPSKVLRFAPPRPLITSAVDSPPSRRLTIADHHSWNPLLKASLLGPVSSSFITCVPSSCKSPVRAIAARQSRVALPSAVGSLAEPHHCSRLVMEKPPVRPEIDIGAPATVAHEPLWTELTRSMVNPPLTELTRSTQSTEQIQHLSSSIPTPNLPKKIFAEVIALSRASKPATPAPHKYFPEDSPSAGIGIVFTGDKGPTLIFTDAEAEVLAAPLKFALVGKFLHGAPLYSILHKLIAGTGIKNKFTVSMLNNRHVLISLSCEADFSRLWLRRIWYIQGYPMRIFKWTHVFTPSNYHYFILT
ncbi:UNVERIFIED_CONTAM: hypothetical protein Sindi_2930700 [Sesamum indicum]